MQSRIKTDSPINGHFCRIFNFAVVLFLTWIAYTRGYAQTHFDNYDHAQGEYNNSLEKTFTLEKRSFMETESAASTWFDVTYYRLALEIFTQPNSLQGKVTVVGTCRDSATSLSLDLVNQMHIDSVRVDGRTMPFTQNSDWFTILHGFTRSANRMERKTGGHVKMIRAIKPTPQISSLRAIRH
jgi:hypothetical protein